MFLQNRNCSKEILTIIIIPPWFQACIYWKKFVIWQHHFQPTIFSIIVSLFHGGTWSNPHVKESVFLRLVATIHYNKRSVVDSRKSWRVYLFQENHCSPALLKVPICSTELIAIIFFEQYYSTILNARKYSQRSHSFMVNQHGEITLTFSKILKRSAVCKG